MKYLQLDEKNIVRVIIPEFDPIFPNIPISERYSKVYLKTLVTVGDEVTPIINYQYDSITGKFTEYIEPVVEVVPEIVETELPK